MSSSAESGKQLQQPDALCQAVGRSREAARMADHYLRDTAAALARVGMHTMAEEIVEQLPQLTQAADELSRAYAQHMTASIRHGEAMMAGLLRVGLRMAEQEGALAAAGLPVAASREDAGGGD